MAWFECDASKLIKLRKFRDLRVDLKWSVNEALGFLSSFVGAVVELNETGEISDWDADYLCELTHVSTDDVDSQAVWDSLVKREFIDKQGDRFIVRDYLDFAGSYLMRKYHNSDRQKLVMIWSLHGRIYGRGGGDNPPGRSGDKEDNSGEKFSGTTKESIPFPQGSKGTSLRISEQTAEEKLKKPLNFLETIASLPPGPPFSQRQRQEIPSGSPPTTAADPLPTSPPNSETETAERRDPVVRILTLRFRDMLAARLKEPPANFNYGAAGKGFKTLLREYSADQIVGRFSNWFSSTGWAAAEHGFSVEMFFKKFNMLKDGPIVIPNSVGSNAPKRYADGLATAGAERDFPE